MSTDSALKISYASSANSSVMTAKALTMLEEVAMTAKVTAFTITSTSRTVNDQARIMFEQTRLYGVKYVNDLYGTKGDEVIVVYEKFHKDGKSDAEIKAAMALKIIELGPSTVSNHIVTESNKRCVFDIGPRSVVPQKQRSELEAAIESHRDVECFLKPPRDKAYHIEVTE